MDKNFIKYFFISITAMYAFYKLLNRKPQNKYVQLFLILFSSILSMGISLLSNNQQTIRILISFTILFLTMKNTEKLPLPLIYITSLFAYAFSYIVFTISIIFTTLPLIIFYYKSYTISWVSIHIFIGVLQFMLIYFCFHIPRLQKGMVFLYNSPAKNTGSTLCIVFIMQIMVAIQTKIATVSYMFVFFSFILLSSILLIYWWNYHITQTYRKFLRKNELDSLNLLLEERNQKILYLKNQNDELARLIHKDNKIIPAITSAIMESYENKITLDLTEWETDSPLCLKLKQLYDERVNMLETYHNEIMNLPKTGFDSINATLSFIHSEASKTGIPFQIVLYDNLKTTIPDEITEDDFNHMLSDLLSNAINACKNISSGSIQIYLGKTEEISIIKICNTGSVFHLETLKNLGLAKHTTHADTGGSGIGLMDIWKIKEKYKASLLIDEISDAASSETYTCMNILFNRKNHFMIQSDRYKELATYLNRPDVMIISKE